MKSSDSNNARDNSMFYKEGVSDDEILRDRNTFKCDQRLQVTSKTLDSNDRESRDS